MYQNRDRKRPDKISVDDNKRGHDSFLESGTYVFRQCKQAPLELPWACPGLDLLPSFDVGLRFRHVISGSLAFVFLFPTWRDLSRTFSVMLTTQAFDRSSSRWFEACPCRPTSEDLPPSSVQLHTVERNSLSPSLALVAHQNRAYGSVHGSLWGFE